MRGQIIKGIEDKINTRDNNDMKTVCNRKVLLLRIRNGLNRRKSIGM